MSTVEQAWAAELQHCRWFGGKGRAARISALEPLPWLTDVGQWPAVRCEIATVVYADTSTAERYQLVVGYRPADSAPQHSVWQGDVPGLGAVSCVDATSDPAGLAALVDALRCQRSGVRWLAHRGDILDGEVRRYTGEQSNTTILIGAGTLLKLFRKLEPGDNREAHILAALHDSAITPALYGVFSAAGYDLGLICERVTSVEDGWDLATRACAAESDFTAPARALGVALRHLHHDLADAEGTGQRDGGDVVADMIGRLDAAAAQTDVIAALRDPAATVLARLGTAPVTTQRIHGDFHLGQALHRSPGAERSEWVIIDFEGEPMASPEQRDAPDSVWRDVAGALRSFDYARSAHAQPQGPAASTWCRHARAAFLDGYLDGAVEPTDVVHAYQLDKAIYEVVYELRNRPDWAHIPIAAVQDEVEGILPRTFDQAKEQ